MCVCVYIYAMKSRTNRRQIAQTDKHVIHILQNRSNCLCMISSQLFLVLYWYSYS